LSSEFSTYSGAYFTTFVAAVCTSIDAAFSATDHATYHVSNLYSKQCAVSTAHSLSHCTTVNTAYRTAGDAPIVSAVVQSFHASYRSPKLAAFQETQWSAERAAHWRTHTTAHFATKHAALRAAIRWAD
jgi:Sec7-like guanine-nucleotide exchange factor